MGSDVRNDILSTILGIGSLQANSSFVDSHPQLSSPRVSTSEKINGSVRHHLLIRRDLISSLICWICRSLAEDAPPLLKIPLLREWLSQGTKIGCGISRGCWYASKFSWSNVHDQERFSTFWGLPPLKKMENLPRVQPRFYRNRVISTTGILYINTWRTPRGLNSFHSIIILSKSRSQEAEAEQLEMSLQLQAVSSWLQPCRLS